jgi:hypothetical protein
MCYEFSGWFGKVRARELQKAREKTDAAKRTTREAPARQPERTEPKVNEPEKIPA